MPVRVSNLSYTCHGAFSEESLTRLMLDFTIIITFAVILTTPGNGADLALDMISNNIYIKRSKSTNDVVMRLYSSKTKTEREKRKKHRETD